MERQLENFPNVQLKNLGLSINRTDININKNNSYAIINGSEYFSKDFINNLVNEDTTITMQNDIMYTGKVISDKANLFSQRIVDPNNYEFSSNITDSYGNTHSRAARFHRGQKVVFSLDGKYSLLKFKIAIDEESNSGYSCAISIKADEQIIYTSIKLDKITIKELE